MKSFTLLVAVMIVGASAVTMADRDRDHDRSRDRDTMERAARDTFNNPIAQQGMVRHQRAMQEAETAYRQAMIAAHEAYYRDLRDALAAARTNRNTPEIAKLSAEMQRIQTEIDRLWDEDDKTNGRGRTYDVFANRDWQPIIQVREGDLLVIQASGSWSFSRAKNAREWGPEGAGTGIGRLMGRVGNQEFEIGASRRIVAPASGILEMRANDTDFRDNSGKVQVKLIVRPTRN